MVAYINNSRTALLNPHSKNGWNLSGPSTMMLLKRHFLTSVYYEEDVRFLKIKLKDIIKKCLDKIAEHLGEEGLEQVLISDWYVA